MKTWTKAVFASPLLALAMVGCASAPVKGQATPVADESKLGKTEHAELMLLQRQQTVDAQNRVTLAQANETTAKKGLEEAKQLRNAAERDLQGHGIQAAVANEAGHDKARADLARAKFEYADTLVALKHAELERARAEIEMSKTNLDLTKTRIAVRSGQADASFAVQAEQRFKEAEDRWKRAKSNTDGLKREAADLKYTWDRQEQIALGKPVSPAPAGMTMPAKEPLSAEKAAPAPVNVRTLPDDMPNQEAKEPSTVLGR